MSTSNVNGAPHGALPKLPEGKKVVVVAAEWNHHITGPLTDGAVAVLREQGVACEVLKVPGTVELTYAAARVVNARQADAVIIIGCVIRGGTPHFDYVCQSVTEGMTALNARGEVPVIFGVLTVDTEQDALDRAGGVLGNKGSEAAEAAVMMIDFSLKTAR